jgi:hypothetical protein
MSLETVEEINNFFNDLEKEIEEKKKLITHDKARAHEVLTVMNNIFAEYNKNGLLKEDGTYNSSIYYKVLQKDMQDGLTLIKFLKTKALTVEKFEPLNLYHIMCGKCLIRLSCLTNKGRIETSEEYSKWIGLYK